MSDNPNAQRLMESLLAMARREGLLPRQEENPFLPSLQRPPVPVPFSTPPLPPRSGPSSASSRRNSSARTESPYATPKKFEVQVICLPEIEPTRKPTPDQLMKLEKVGLGLKKVVFYTSDSYELVKERLIEAFPALGTIGEFRMLKQDGTGNSRKIARIEARILNNGSELQTCCGKIYVAPMHQQIIVTVPPTGYYLKCTVCYENIDSSIYDDHVEGCGNNSNTVEPQQNTLDDGNGSEIPPDSPIYEAAVNALKDAVLETCDLELGAFENQSITVTRANAVNEALEKAQCPIFWNNIRLPLLVTFRNEPGVDGGALKLDLLTLILDFLEQEIETNNWNDEKKFAAGLWSGLAVIQGYFCEEFLYRYFLRRDVAFLRGLERSNALQIYENRTVRPLFRKRTLTAEYIFNLLQREQGAASEVLETLEKLTMDFFKNFLTELEQGGVDGLTMKHALLFLTGARRIPSIDTFEKITLQFVLNKDGERRCPVVAACAGLLTMPMCSSYGQFRNVWILALSDDRFSLA